MNDEKKVFIWMHKPILRGTNISTQNEKQKKTPLKDGHIGLLLYI